MPRRTPSIHHVILVVVLTLVVTACSSKAKPPAEEPNMTSAMAHLQTGDFAGAAKTLEQITVRQPNNGRAWRNLALAYQHLKEWDRAIDANRRALEVDPANPSPLFSLGVAYAVKGNKKQAFSWLEKAKVTRKV